MRRVANTLSRSGFDRPGATYQLRPWAKSAEALDKEATIPN